MSVKKSFTIFLSCLLALCMLSGAGNALAAEVGETAEVSFGILANPENAVDILIALEYDHEALELVPNYIFNRDRKVSHFNEILSAVFRIREGARPGLYPVTIRVLDAAGIDGAQVSRFPTYSEAVITVKSPPVEVPVYYMQAGYGNIVATDSITLAAGRTAEVKANPPEGWVISGEKSMPVTVTEDGRAMPSSVTFWLTEVVSATGTPTPTPTRPSTIPPRPIRATPTPTLVDFWGDGLAAAATPDVLAPVAAPMLTALATGLPSQEPASTPVPVRVGGYITFGHYEQDNNTRNGKEPIEWLVLDVQGNQALVISRYGLDAKPYNTSLESVTWETCSLRKWLNGEFLNNAFTAGEQKAIIRTKVDNGAGQGYSGWDTDGGKNTEDRIFLLSYAEAWRYFNSASARQCHPTRYAEGRGADTSGGKCFWWLRSPGYNQNRAAFISTGGSLYFKFVYIDNSCVRPALWINLDSGIFGS